MFCKTSPNIDTLCVQWDSLILNVMLFHVIEELCFLVERRIVWVVDFSIRNRVIVAFSMKVLN